MTQHDNSHHNNAGEGVSSATTVRRNNKVSWTPLLHSRFVDAILFIGYQSAAPANILEIMKEPGLTWRQVGSHLQKYQKFVQGVLDGTTNIQFNRWIDLKYKSSYFSGNPDLLLINHLREERRRGRLSAHNPLRPTSPVRAPNGSSTSGQYRPLLPPSTMAVSSMRSVALTITHSESMGNIAGYSTSNTIHDLTYRTAEMRYYNENTLTQEQNNYPGNGGLVGGAINDVIPSTNNVVPSSTAPVGDNVYSQSQSMHVGWRGSGNSYYGNDFNTDQATHQLGNNSGDSSIGRSLNASQFGNTSAMNAHSCWGPNAPRGKSASSKMAKQAALSFVKRTLAQCREYDVTGKSCFSEPLFWEMLLSRSSQLSDAQQKDATRDGESGKHYGNASGCSVEGRVSGCSLKNTKYIIGSVVFTGQRQSGRPRIGSPSPCTRRKNLMRCVWRLLSLSKTKFKALGIGSGFIGLVFLSLVGIVECWIYST